MPETNGHQDNGFRLDRIEAATGGKLSALIDIVDHNSRKFHDRLNRLEGRN